jgi:hypothetical protein
MCAFDSAPLWSFVPQSSWLYFDQNELDVPVDGPLTVGEIIPCRGVNGGGGGCPAANEAFPKSMVVGGVGHLDRNLFGFEVSGFTAQTLRQDPPQIQAWPDEGAMWNLTPSQEPDLGLSVSRPILAHL